MENDHHCYSAGPYQPSNTMGGSDMQFCLRWNNFGTTMTAALHTLHEGGDFVDVTLAADGVQLKAHKLILSACSPYFRDILKVDYIVDKFDTLQWCIHFGQLFFK